MIVDGEGGGPRPVRRSDYRPPDYGVDHIQLDFDLDEAATTVRSRLDIRRGAGVAEGTPLRLDGQGLELAGLRLDGRPLATDRFVLDDEGLLLKDPPERFVLEIETRIAPRENTALQGLYFADGIFTTQCEAEGFRRITYYPDRPDVMATFTTTIRADRGRFPVLLANGNRVAHEELPDGCHWVRWEDPFPKPCYLFALVAGDLACVRDRFVTMSGREVALEIYVEGHNADQCDHAIRSLKAAMRWDEGVYGREYDLDLYMIVAVESFNMGAMENKGLNVFNAKYVLAAPETATDQDYQGIESVIAHEYFHNWTGNRVTLRDWFQLSLKEGLTVFRDQEFSADQGSRAVKRIADVRRLRAHQFPEDAGPLAHPVRPDSYIEINNFYTATVYEKGAELVRMVHTLLGPEGFRRGMDRYFACFDGQAVTIEDFLAAMEEANGRDLRQFRLWYAQAGTPVVTASSRYDEGAHRYTLTLRQHTPPTPGQEVKEPLPIPVRMALLDPNGVPLPIRLAGDADVRGMERVLDFHRAEAHFVFEDVSANPVPSLMRGFSAPVRLNLEIDEDGWRFLALHDNDPFNRWEAGQRLYLRVILAAISAWPARVGPDLPGLLHDLVGGHLRTCMQDPAFAAETMTLPGEDAIGEEMDCVAVDAIHGVREGLRQAIGTGFCGEWADLYQRLAAPYALHGTAMGRRRLRNLALAYLMASGDGEARSLCLRQYREADNMTDRLAALTLLAHREGEEGRECLADFYRRWRDHSLVLDKWFAIQAGSPLPSTLDRVRELLDHPDFHLRNPNRVRALLGTFSANMPRFHDAGGGGYALLAEQLLRLDDINPITAARMATPLTRWRRFDRGRAERMRAALEALLGKANLSKDVYEVAAKSLPTVDAEDSQPA